VTTVAETTEAVTTEVVITVAVTTVAEATVAETTEAVTTEAMTTHYPRAQKIQQILPHDSYDAQSLFISKYPNRGLNRVRLTGLQRGTELMRQVTLTRRKDL
jgi:hypothetical protein